MENLEHKKNELPKRRRKKITEKIKNQVFKRDNYTCQICGKTPALCKGLALEVDHIIPFSKGGLCEISNYQTKCMPCNRGKGNNEEFEKTILIQLNAILECINPEILKQLALKDCICVIANQEDYIELSRLNSLCSYYKIKPTQDTIIGQGAMKNAGIYTLIDNCGSKVRFFLSKTLS